MTGEPSRTSVRGQRADACRNHERIIRAAGVLLAEHPGATMEELTAATGLGRTTVYRHFHTREQLVGEVYQDAFTGARQVFVAAQLTECPLGELVERAVTATMEAVQAYPVLVNGPGLDVAVGGGLPHDYADCLEPLRLALARGQAAGILNPALPSRWLAGTLLDDCAGAARFSTELREAGQDPRRLVGEAFVRAWSAR
ncbi:transcriptional regulator, TetR family [Marinactinospora thermotolerans DSM 45154]|uniref:Transcriptional regulator, TetR family n=1 Tax=Marinactinospora thermotolerans DSM 45154 TaxID=1122192 RepID=A0A1T4P6N9_9ACTN|nr:TetR/AcrR family transcriptional regulator [Marinactinospora thermotolerans]SJZ86876.1 transcriptional regulator, TetR family [Marinactinospora thermotolerans DSM 45154]